METPSHTNNKASFQKDRIYGNQARDLHELKLNSSFVNLKPLCFKVDRNYINYFSKSGFILPIFSENSVNLREIDGVWDRKAFCKEFVVKMVRKISKNGKKRLKSAENTVKNCQKYLKSTENIVKNSQKSGGNDKIPLKSVENYINCQTSSEKSAEKAVKNSTENYQKLAALETMFYKVSGFPASKHHIELNGNYVPVGTNAGRPFLVNRHFVYLFFKGGTWRLGTQLWVDEVIGYTRGDAVEDGRSVWNVVDNEGGYCTVTVNVEKGFCPIFTVLTKFC